MTIMAMGSFMTIMLIFNNLLIAALGKAFDDIVKCTINAAGHVDLCLHHNIVLDAVPGTNVFLVSRKGNEFAHFIATETGWCEGRVHGQVIPVVTTAVEFAVAHVEIATKLLASLQRAVFVVGCVDGITIQSKPDHRTRVALLSGPLRGHVGVISHLLRCLVDCVGSERRGSGTVLYPPFWRFGCGHTQILQKALWWQMVMVLMCLVRMPVANVVGPSGLVTIQQHTIGHHTNGIRVGYVQELGLSRDTRVLGNDHVVKVENGVVGSKWFVAFSSAITYTTVTVALRATSTVTSTTAFITGTSATAAITCILFARTPTAVIRTTGITS